MLQPVGPLSPQVYWRRRLVVAGGVIVVLLLGLALCSGGGPGGTGGTPAGPGGGAALTGSATPSSTAEATITPSPGSAGGPAQGTGGQPSGSTTASDSGSATPSTVPTSAAPPKACPDSALTVTAGSQKPSYRVGETPVLKLSVRNTGTVPCVRDVGPRQQEMLMYTGLTRVWSSNDCYPDGGTDVRTLAPGETITSTVVWSGLSSQPGCAGTRTRVKAGTYQLVARVGGARSKPAKLVLA